MGAALQAVKLVESRVECAGTGMFAFTRPEGYRFAPGQFQSLTLVTREGQQTKSFSHCDAPGEPASLVLTRLTGSAFKDALLALRPGDEVKVAGPFGRLTLPEGTARAGFLVGGVGVTPAASIVGDSVLRKTGLDCLVVYGNRDQSCIPLRERFATYEASGGPVRVVDVLSRPLPGWGGEAGYIFARVRWLRLNNKSEEAGKLILTAPKDPAESVDLDQWWVERRLLIRKLLDDNDAQTAYRVARQAAPPMKGNYRVDAHFTAGWIALRYLHDAASAAAHFAQIPIGTANPHALGRAGYWQGRAAEAMGQRAKAKEFYETGAQYTATYYGQLARARLGLTDLGLRGPPQFTPEERHTLSNLEVVRAAQILYALDEREMLASIYAELGESGTDSAGMAMLAEVAGQHGDGRAMLMLGKGAYGRGLPLDYYAYPIIGLPEFKPIAPPVDPAVTYSIARQESHFNQKVVSTAHAMGFMQVTPAAAEDTAKTFKAEYNRGRLLSDPIYNMQMGTAELSILLKGYNGSYILTFAGYNAGRGRVRQWIAAHGDPRDPKVDPVDWVERIPIAETRNYVQRIMENLQVYRARFGGSNRLVVEADMQRGGAN